MGNEGFGYLVRLGNEGDKGGVKSFDEGLFVFDLGECEEYMLVVWIEELGVFVWGGGKVEVDVLW